MGELLKKINTTTEELQSRFKNLTKDINDVEIDLHNACSGSTNCTKFGINSISITTVANFSNLPDIGVQLNNIAEVNNNNLTQKAEEVC